MLGFPKKTPQPDPEFQEVIPGLPMRRAVPEDLYRLAQLESRNRGFASGLSDYSLGCLQHEVSNNWRRPSYAAEDTEAEKAQRRALLSPLSGRKVIELGFGSTYRRFHNDMLFPEGLAQHIGVDRFAYIPDEGEVLELSNRNQKIGTVANLPDEAGLPKRSIFRGDMLNFLGLLPDASASFVINGVDNQIVDAFTEYGQAVSREVARATEVGGYIVGCTYYGGILYEAGKQGVFRMDRVQQSGTDFISQQRLS